MKIENTNILLASTRTFTEKDEEKESLRVWIGPPDQNHQSDIVTISEKAKSCMANPGNCIDEIDTKLTNSFKTTLKALLVEILSGKDVKIIDASEFQKDQDSTGELQGKGQTENLTQEEREGFGITYNYNSSHYEKEEVSFEAAGVIQTTDGKEIKFSLRLDMGREFISHHSLNFRAGDAVLMDPLIVNFDGRACELANTNFSFDLDSDGVKEDIPMIRPGSGFLALDLNKDGIINNGNELFGPHTGDGFVELSAYDKDTNNWIDENDPVFDQLSVWSIDEQQNSSLNSLKDKGVGAIYLGNLSSNFDLKGNSNELRGQISNTGVFLQENGIPGTIQQLDLVV